VRRPTAIDGRELVYQITILREACSAVDVGNAEVALEYPSRSSGRGYGRTGPTRA
jgi:hypothetical protein